MNIWNVLYKVCSSGFCTRGVPRVGRILLIVKLKWIIGNLTLPRLARTGPPGASLPRCNSVTEKPEVFQINHSIQYATHSAWVTNPPLSADDKISYRVGFGGKKARLLWCVVVKLLILFTVRFSSRKYSGLWNELCVCVCACVCVFFWMPLLTAARVHRGVVC